MTGPASPPEPRPDEDLIGHMEGERAARRLASPAAGIVGALLPGQVLPVYSKAISAGLAAAAAGVSTAQLAGSLSAAAIASIIFGALATAFATLATRNTPPPSAPPQRAPDGAGTA